MLSFSMGNPSCRGSRELANLRTSCPLCAAMDVTLGMHTEHVVCLRCRACHEVWSMPERRAVVRHTVYKPQAVLREDVQPL
jgi:hypothetical protein